MNTNKQETAYGLVLYIVLMIIWNLGFYMPALWMSQGNTALAEPVYIAYSFTCHQLDHRSLCYYPNYSGIIASCNPQDENDFAHGDVIIPDPILGVGYKLAVCSRDVAIYGAMLAGAIIWAVLNMKNLATQIWPDAKWLILATIPIALDGGTQIIGLRQSTNELRVITGAIIGVAVAFYLIPAFNQIFNPIISDVKSAILKK